MALMILQLVGTFVLEWTLPHGTQGPGGRICVADTDHDGYPECIFRTGGLTQKVYVEELHLPDTWQEDSFPYLYSPSVWAIGDFDNDGLCNMIVDAGVEPNPPMVLSVAESPDSFTYPTQEVWRDTVGPPQVLPISAFDIDEDGKSELVKNGATPYGYLGIYESVGDNEYDLIFYEDPDTTGQEAPCSTHGFGDFDQDGQIEFAMSSIGHSSTGAPYWVYECTGDNSYEQVASGYVPTLNVFDCFSVPDADGDGKMEFVIKGYYVGGTIDVFIFEATGDNTYALVDTLHFPGGDYWGGYSTSGDVDGDSIPELVIEALNNIQIVKAYGNDSFAIWQTLPGNGSGSTIALYDLNGNGLNEVIISGNNSTRIYEWQTAVEEMPAAATPRLTLSVTPTVFREHGTISYSLVSSANVFLTLYDASGRLVRVLAEGWQTPGEHRLSLEAGRYPQGVYFVRLVTEGDTVTEKVVLTRRPADARPRILNLLVSDIRYPRSDIIFDAFYPLTSVAVHI